MLHAVSSLLVNLNCYQHCLQQNYYNNVLLEIQCLQICSIYYIICIIIFYCKFFSSLKMKSLKDKAVRTFTIKQDDARWWLNTPSSPTCGSTVSPAYCIGFSRLNKMLNNVVPGSLLCASFWQLLPLLSCCNDKDSVDTSLAPLTGPLWDPWGW